MTQQEAQAMLDSRNKPPESKSSLSQEDAMKMLQGHPGVQKQSLQPPMRLPDPIDVGKHVLADVTKFGQGLANLPNNLSGGRIPEFSRKSFDPYQTFGIEQNLADKAGVIALDFSPFGRAGKALSATKALGVLPGSAMLKANILGGAGYGAVNSPDERGLGALAGGALGGAAHGIGVGAGVIGNKLASAYAKSAIPGLIDRAGQHIKSSLGNPESGATGLKSQYDKISGHADKVWKVAKERAADLDSSGSKINSSPVQKYISGFQKDVKKLTPTSRREYEDAVEFIKKEGDSLIPKNYADVIALRRNSNEIVSDFLKTKNKDAADVNLNKFVSGLKEKLNEALPSSTRAEKNFKTSWDIANKSTARKKEFYQAPGQSGKLEPSKKLREGLKVNNPEGSLVNEFLPNSSQTGTHGFRQLSNLLGSNQKAAEALRNYEFRNLGDKKNALDVYQPLSRAQRQVMFDKNQRELLNAAQQSVLKHGRPSERGLIGAIGHHGISMGLPGALVGGGAYLSGTPGEKAIGLGIGASLLSKGLGMGIGKYASPESVLKALKLSEAKPKYPGIIANPLLNEHYLGKK